MNHLLTVADAVATHARLTPHKLGARDSRRELSFAQWHERATRLANGLLGLGLVKGDRVALLAYNRVEWMELYVALARAGLVAVPINFRLTPPEIAYIVQHSGARALRRPGRTHRSGRIHSWRPRAAAAGQHLSRRTHGAGLDRLRDADRRGLGQRPWRGGAADRPVRADVYLGHHRPAQGCDPQPRGQHADRAGHRAGDALHARRYRPDGDADVPCELAVLQPHLHAPGRGLRHRRSSQLRPRGAAGHAGAAERSPSLLSCRHTTS